MDRDIMTFMKLLSLLILSIGSLFAQPKVVTNFDPSNLPTNEKSPVYVKFESPSILMDKETVEIPVTIQNNLTEEITVTHLGTNPGLLIKLESPIKINPTEKWTKSVTANGSYNSSLSNNQRIFLYVQYTNNKSEYPQKAFGITTIKFNNAIEFDARQLTWAKDDTTEKRVIAKLPEKTKIVFVVPIPGYLIKIENDNTLLITPNGSKPGPSLVRIITEPAVQPNRMSQLVLVQVDKIAGPAASNTPPPAPANIESKQP